MKKLFILIGVLQLASFAGSSQVLKRIGDRAKQKIERKAGDKVEKTIDDATDGKKSEQKSEEDAKPNDTKTKEANSQTGNSEQKSSTLAFNSKYDFVPGEKVIAFEDFSNAAVGDFPTRWNTNATAEIVTLNTKEGKWIKINKEGVFHPEFITSLPENFTLEFNLGVNNNWGSDPLFLNIANLEKPEDYTDYNHYVSWRGKPAIHLEFRPGQETVKGWSRVLAGKDGNHTINNTVEFQGWNNSSETFAHIALWRQNQRLRVYLNGEKIWDLPRAFDAVAKYNAITIAARGTNKADDYYVLGNLRLASGAPDTRNKLVTEGKFVTRGILFDVNSDQIKPESGGVLKEIATVLKENPDLKVRITGHTDGDGDDKANLNLSNRRSEAVKAWLVKEFGISGDRITTEGKGESEPADNNTTSEGKANNRRVEFTKV